MKRKIKMLMLACIMFVTSSAYASLNFMEFYAPRPDPLDWEVGTLNINTVLVLHGIMNRLGDHWSVRQDMLGLNNLFTYSTLFNSRNQPWYGHGTGQTFYLNVGVRPTYWFYADVGLRFVGDHPDRLFMPVNQSHRLHNDGINFPRFYWERARIRAENHWASVAYMRGYGHLGWGEDRDGDMFNLFMRQDNPDDILRISGRPVPEFFNVQMRGEAGDFEVHFGQEVVESYTQGIYLRYSNIFGSNINFFYTDHVIPFGDPGERMRNFQVNTDFDLWRGNLQVGGLFRPFRLDREYQYLQRVAPGTGAAGSDHILRTGTTGLGDAFGIALRYQLPNFIGIDMLRLRYEYRGLVAGNRQMLTAGIEQAIVPSFTGAFTYTYIRPLRGAIPLLFSGPGGAGPNVFEPRGPSSPFWVWWRSADTGFDNRHRGIASFVFTYNPTPEVPFYAFEHNVVEEWNINPYHDAEFSFATRINLERFFSTTDRQIYRTYDGVTAWENVQAAGAFPARTIASIYWLGKLMRGRNQILMDFEVGQDLARSSYAYNNSEPYLFPIIGYFRTSLSLRRDRWLFRIGYARGHWGTEAWHREFGAVYDELYRAHVSKDVIPGTLNIGLDYVGARITDNHLKRRINNLTLGNEMGHFDEFRLRVRLHFDSIIRFGRRVPESILEVHDMPPSVSLAAIPAAFMPARDETTTLLPWAMDISGIDNWRIFINDPFDEETLRTFYGQGNPPTEIIWDGTDEYGQVLPENTYPARLKAFNAFENYAVTEPTRITVRWPLQIDDADIVEGDGEIRITLGARVLFEFAMHYIRPGAANVLRQVAALISERYPHSEVLIEGHTDSVGSHAFNMGLGDRRANAVLNFLVAEGLDRNNLVAESFGFTRPVADNATYEGREQNRRVEIVIRTGDGRATRYITGDDTIEVAPDGTWQ
ncbi:MAG: OmpA family protein [Elusimicrobia bacterium]|nr:OmpA family protein [Elusimicrobiota bacterium]